MGTRSALAWVPDQAPISGSSRGGGYRVSADSPSRGSSGIAYGFWRSNAVSDVGQISPARVAVFGNAHPPVCERACARFAASMAAVRLLLRRSTNFGRGVSQLPKSCQGGSLAEVTESSESSMSPRAHRRRRRGPLSSRRLRSGPIQPRRRVNSSRTERLQVSGAANDAEISAVRPRQIGHPTRTT